MGPDYSQPYVIPKKMQRLRGLFVTQAGDVMIHLPAPLLLTYDTTSDPLLLALINKCVGVYPVFHVLPHTL